MPEPIRVDVEDEERLPLKLRVEDPGLELLAEQALANGVTIVYSGVVTAVILLAIKATIGLRVTEEVEATGLDVAEHAETAYNTGDAFMERAGF